MTFEALQRKRRRNNQRANTSERGYGNSHQQERRKWAPKVARGEVNCNRCGGFIKPGTPWDLGHDDLDRTIYRGPEHQKCNRATSKHKSEREGAQERRNSRNW